MPGALRILVTCRTCGDAFLASLSGLGEVVLSPLRSVRALTESELVEQIRGVDIVVAGVDPFTKRVIEEGARSRLSAIARFGIGLDNVDLAAATANKVIITYAPKAAAASVAEFALAVTLALLKRIPEASAAVRSGDWPMAAMRGAEVRGKTVGIIGLGTIGERVAEMFSALGAKVIAYDPYRKGADPRLTDLETLLRSSDVVTIHSALTPTSTHIVGKKELALMKKSAVLINTSRGAVVDHAALHDALIRKTIAGAALDVLETEPPPPGDALSKLPNVIVTPHIAGNTNEATERIGGVLLDDIKRVIDGEPPLHPANPEVLAGLSQGALRRRSSSS
jgi:D-3-phosphoglycerate dehydrogenase